MTTLCVAPIVEGHGEHRSIRILLERLVRAIDETAYVDVLRPIRRPRSSLVREDKDDLERCVQLAAAKLGEKAARLPGARALVLLLLDADEDCPATRGPELLRRISSTHSGVEALVVLAKTEYETWFVAAAQSLGEFLGTVDPTELPASPEESGAKKGWIQHHYPRYSETVDQPRMTAAMDLELAVRRSPSLARFLERLRGLVAD